MEQKHTGTDRFKGKTRLPEFAVPKSYDLHLKPDLSVCSFSGSVNIKLSIQEPTKVIVLNALELDIHEVVFTDFNNHQYYPSDVILENDDEILVLVFDDTLAAGEGVLGINFSAMLNEHLRGLYKCTCMDGEEKKNMAVTQFEAVDARRCFPCWDEPALKATFKVTIDVPPKLTALSNMPIIEEKYDGNVKTVYFEESPLMSTYLVAVVVGLFDHIEDTTADGIKVGVYCPVGSSDKGKYALNIAVKALDLYTDYFSMPYPLPKLDMVSVPEFAGGAMENYGLIIYHEIDLLHDELLSTADRKQRLTIVVLHEVSHQWFVTMEWWTHLWLNEGFATWISYMATDRLFPEWKIWNQFLQLTSSGLHIDALGESHPIEVEIQHARSVGEIFDVISYKKGSAVIRMLQGYLGDDIIQKSLVSYMKKYAWGNAKTEDLWSIISEESGVQVNSVMDCWTKQKGYPVISVRFKDGFLEFEQSQFLSSGLQGEGTWIVPITFLLGPNNIGKNFLLQSQVERMEISNLVPSSLNEEKGEKCEWVKVNIEQSGFYRVKYGEELSAAVRIAVKNNCLSSTDKFGILDDTYALCEACELPLSSLLSLMDVYRKELDYVVVSRLINVCYKILEISRDAIPDSVYELKTFFINLLQFSAEKLGWESEPDESHLNALLRGEIYGALATFGHHKTHNEALKRFHALLNDRNSPLLPVGMRKAAYISVIRNTSDTNRSGFEHLLKIYREADTVQEKERILSCIASSPDPNIVVEALNFLVSDEVRDQDIVYGLIGISLEGREMAWTWLKENWDMILHKYGAALLITHFIRDAISHLCSNEKADEVEEFFGSRMSPAIAMNLKQSIEKVRIKARWIHSIKQETSLEEPVKELARNP
ncbi:aminopeptidase M1 [Euphorbia peplus]|nr:aminopeptidase M1 [Euphorbia peplus]